MAMAMVFPATNVRFPQPVISAGTSSNQKRRWAVPARQQRVVSVRTASSPAAATENVDAAAAAAASTAEDAPEAAAAAQVDAGESSSTGAASGKLSKKAKLAIRSSNKQILSLRFLWMEKNIGIALDQVVPGHGTIPLSPFYFWPKKDAWEELKAKLESKPWISRRRTIILLNQATDIINLWQQKASTF